jgi:hypothetical protein
LTPGPYPMPWASAATTPAKRTKPAPATIIRFMTSPVALTAKRCATMQNAARMMQFLMPVVRWQKALCAASAQDG